MADQRKTQLNLVVGINGTGKTTFIRQNIVEKRKKVLVITPDDSEWRQLPTVSTPEEIYNMQQPSRLIYADGCMEMVTRYYFGGALVLDDAMAYMKFQTDDTMRFLYIRRRQRGVDVFFVAHGLRQVPVQCFTFGSYLFLFATTENFSSRKKELADDIFKKILTAQTELNRNCHRNPYAHTIIKLDPTL